MCRITILMNVFLKRFKETFVFIGFFGFIGFIQEY